MLGKVALAIASVSLLPVVFIAAAGGGLDAEGATTAAGVICPPDTGGQHPAAASGRARANGQVFATPCKAGELEGVVLSNGRIGLRPEARGDVAAGLIDPRVLQVLLFLAERHDLSSVGPLVSAHSYYVRGTSRPSNHAFGRAVDISVIDGVAVSIANSAALDAMVMILSLPPPLLPDELGGPWLLHHPPVRVFTRDHGDHIHVGWDG